MKETFQIAEFNEIVQNPNDKTILTVNTYRRGTIDIMNKKSFELKFNSKEQCQSMCGKIEDLKKQAKRFIDVRPGSEHIGHQFKRYEHFITSEAQVFVKYFKNLKIFSARTRITSSVASVTTFSEESSWMELIVKTAGKSFI